MLRVFGKLAAVTVTRGRDFSHGRLVCIPRPCTEGRTSRRRGGMAIYPQERRVTDCEYQVSELGVFDQWATAQDASGGGDVVGHGAGEEGKGSV